MKNTPGTLTQLEIDRIYDALAALVDQTPAAEREKVLARLAIALAERVDNYGKVVEAINSVANTQSVPPSTAKR
jgi:hypothetical protein